MPKAIKTRKGAHNHDQSVKLTKRQFAVQEDAVEHIEIGAAVDVPAEELLATLEEPRTVLNKKERQQIKREAFREHLESTHAPYSKSHERRQKKKAKEQIAGGLGDISAVIAAMDDTVPEPTSNSNTMDDDAPKPTPKPKLGQIGEGKSSTLTKNERKNALKMERLRHPLILSNPSYATNPFATIRTHAQNTLLKREKPA